MSAKKELPLQEYIQKLQEAAGKIVNKRQVVNFESIDVLEDKFASAPEDEQMGLAIFKEALSKVNKRYELKAEAACASRPNAPKAP